MSYSRVEDLLAKIVEREEIHGLVEPKHSPDAKYKKNPKNKPGRPTLRVGSRLVWAVGQGRYQPGSIKSYAMGVVLDWGGHGKPSEEESWGDERTWWCSKDCIVQVTRVSNPEFEWLVGHLRQVTLYGYSKAGEMPLFTPEECAAKDYGL